MIVSNDTGKKSKSCRNRIDDTMYPEREVKFKLTVEMINNQHNKQVSDSLNEK